jgi:hypothetical protein
LAVQNLFSTGVYYAKLLATDIRRLNLTLRPSLDDLPGHVLIPEINYNQLKADKKGVKQMAMSLANLVTPSSLWGPSSPPRADP